MTVAQLDALFTVAAPVVAQQPAQPMGTVHDLVAMRRLAG